MDTVTSMNIRCRMLSAILLTVATGAGATAAPVERCDDATFLRRASLDLIGRQPTPAEIAAFTADRDPAKRSATIDRLLADKAWAATWARYFRDVILFRRSDDRAALMSGPLEQYLTARLAADARWDEIARGFITATGIPAEHGETAIIMAQMGETSDIAAEVSRIFLGIQIQCAQCHDHFTDRWKRAQFHEFAAFFPRIAIRRADGMGAERFEVVSHDFEPRGRSDRKKPPVDNPRRGDLEHEMPDLKDPSRPGTVMQPRFFLTGQSLPVGTSDLDRRAAIADWITADDNEWFARALVNRLWSELVGAGFYRGIDDIGPDREAESPEVLDEIAAAFVASGHDLRAVFRTIMRGDAYQRASRSRSNPERAAFAANCPQRLRADQLFTQVLTAVGVDESRLAGPGGQVRRRENAPTEMRDEPPDEMMAGPRRQLNVPRAMFGQVFGYDPSLPREEIVGSIPQALLLMNSQPLARAIDGDRRFTALGRLLAEDRDDREVVAELYLRSLARLPTPDEVATCLDHVRKSASRAEGFEDVFWALINSAEFVTRN
jgi:hypothetical protein